MEGKGEREGCRDYWVSFKRPCQCWTALDTDSFDNFSKTHELRDSRNVVALSQSVLADTNVRSYSDSSRFGSFC